MSQQPYNNTAHPPQQQQQQQQGQQGQQQPRPSAWQPAPPTSLQTAATGPGAAGRTSLQQATGNAGQFVPPGAGGQGGIPPGGPPQYHHQQQQYPGAHYQYGGGYQHPHYSQRPAGLWQPAPPQNQQQQPQGGRVVGGLYYPSQQQQQQSGQQRPPPSVTPKKKPVITDKDGNVIDLLAPRKKKEEEPQTKTPSDKDTSAGTAPTADAGAKLRQAALERIQAAEKDKEGAKEKEAEEKAKKEAEEKAKKEAEEKAKKEAEEQAKREAEEKAKKEAEEKAKKEAEEKAKKEAAGRGLKRIWTKEELMKFRELDICMCRPDDLPEMTIQRDVVQGGGDRGRRGSSGGRRQQGGDGGNWNRGEAPPRDGPRRSQSGGGDWSRGHAPPPQKRGSRGGRGGQAPLYDGPVAPLVKSENRWMPKKNTSAMVVTEKKVKSILNKMTKEKFDRLSDQMCEIPILSYEMLTMMIHIVYEKAIDEPNFGDMYADLCAKLSHAAQANTANFVKIIESDEEPSGGVAEENEDESDRIVYRWSNDVGLTDDEIVGPFESPEDCLSAAMTAASDPDNAAAPTERGEMEMELVSLQIKNDMFIKIMQKKQKQQDPETEEGEVPDDDEANVYYTVFFPVSEAAQCGQQMSQEVFLSERECVSDANKQNSFKRSLLNKCEDEFNKQDIYVDWKKEKKAYDESKASLTEAEQSEKQEELDFRRMKIKKQMLGNIKFIGQLYKKGLLKEKIMRFCIGSLLKLEELKDKKYKNPEYKDTGDMEMDEEDHEALCNLFTTIGSTIDQQQARSFMKVCFTKMTKLSTHPDLSVRYRFMYKDLLDLRANRWVLRRKVETAKTLEEIRKDAEREERQQAQQAQQMGGYRGGGGKGGDRSRGGRDYGDNRGGKGGGDYRNSGRQGSFRQRQQRTEPQVDEDGFAVVGRGGAGGAGGGRGRGPPQGQPQSVLQPQRESRQAAPKPSKPAPEPLGKDKLELRIDNIRNEFMQDRKNVDELLLSFDEIRGTPDAGLTLVQRNADRIFDCNDEERQTIVAMFVVLFTKGKLKSTDISGGMADAIEFIESFVIDSPKAFEYLGEILGAMLFIKALNVPWLCEQCKKLTPGTDAAERVVKSTMIAIKQKKGIEDLKPIFSGTIVEAALKELLGGADKWQAIVTSVVA